LRRYARHRGAAVEFLDPQPRPDYLRLLTGARYAVNPSRQEAYSIFGAEALAMAVPTITTPEVAENLQAEAEPFRSGLVAIKHAPILSWNQRIPKYLALYEDSAN
ncbi:MAG: glycosyltransferase family 1 protein, partial [Pyrobaculum sp.]